MYKATPNLSGKSLIAKRIRKAPPVLVFDGAWLKDVKEECFAILIADGIPLAIAYKTAGFTTKDGKSQSAHALFKAPRVQARVTAILQARASSPAVSLPEVTDMLKRVYTGAIHSGEYNPAHNAAFSLARLYGLVVDRAQLDVIRRPSREPDAPAEQELSSWIAALPTLELSAGNSTTQVVSSVNTTQVVSHAYATEGPIIEGSAFGSDLDGPGGIGNGAPTRPVTGTPYPGGRSGHGGPGVVENGSPDQGVTSCLEPGGQLSFAFEAAGPRADHDPAMQSPAASRDAAIPSAEELF